MKKTLLLWLMLLFVSLTFSQTTLSVGEVAITSFNSDGNKDFSFVVLKDIDVSTEIHFTDEGFDSGALRNTEGTYTWTATANVSCGTEVVVDTSTDTSSIGNLVESNLGFALSTGGDQILVYQGTSVSPTFIFAINFNSTNWVSGNNSNSTDLPTGLSDTVNAVNLGEIDNAQYNCSAVNSEAAILGAIAIASNWNLDNTNEVAAPACAYSCVPVCTPATIASVSPISGSVGTIVTISASSGDLTSATATIGGTAATIVSSSTTQLVVQVPSGANTGDIVITDNQPCDVTYSSFTVLDTDNTSCEFVAAFSELFISEVTDASSGSLSYIEIFNATGATVDMTDYEVQIRNNGNPTGSDIALTGTLAHGNSFILATAVGAGCSVPGGNAEYADQTDVSSGVNNNDCIHLANLGTVIDTWGVCDGSNWVTAAGLGSAGYDFQRKSTATAPNTTFALADWNIVDYDSCDDNYTDIETYVGSNPAPIINTQPSISLDPCDIATSLTVGASEGLAGGLGLAYQWYVHVPGAAGWTALTDSAIYSGSTSSTLNILSIIGLDNYQYYCQVRENSATCYTASEAVQLSSTISSVWNGSVWSAAPDNTKIVVVDADYDTAVNGSFDACSLIVNAGVTLDIKAGDYVNVVNDLTVNGDMQVRHEGSFVQENDAGLVALGASGNIDVHKTTTSLLNWYSYTFWSSPIVDDTVGSALSSSHPVRRHVFLPANFNDANADGVDDNGDDWRYAPGGETMTPGVGYVACSQTSATYPGHQQNVAFNGRVNNGVVTTPISIAAVPETWNIIGNPYPSAIDSHAFVAGNAGVVDNTFYLWTHNSDPIIYTGPYGYDFTTDDYATYNTAIASGTAASSGGSAPSRYIASCQSFLIRGVSAANATFNNSMRVKTNNDSFFRNSSEEVISQRDLVWLNLKNESGAFNQILIGFLDGASNSTDVYDSKKRESPKVSFYSIINNKGYAINGRQVLTGDEEIPLGFTSKVPGAFPYEIEIDHTEGNLEAYDIYLEDKELNVLHDLRLGKYNVVLDQGVYDDRFALVLKRREMLGVDEVEFTEDSIVVYENNNQLEVISGVKSIKQISMHDVLGKQIFTHDIDAKKFNTSTSQLSNTMYVVSITLENNQKVTKKFVKR